MDHEHHKAFEAWINLMFDTLNFQEVTISMNCDGDCDNCTIEHGEVDMGTPPDADFLKSVGIKL